MTAITADLQLPVATDDADPEERRRIARLIAVGSASFTLLIALVAALLAIAA